MVDDVKKTTSTLGGIGSLFVIGLFLGVFGIAVIVAIFFTDTTPGKITNLICGCLFIISALVAMFQSKIEKPKKKDDRY